MKINKIINNPRRLAWIVYKIDFFFAFVIL